MRILGVSFDYHDAAAALVVDGDVVAAAHEERFSRIKGDASLPANAIQFCLGQAGIAARDLDWIVFYENPMVKFNRILTTALCTLPQGKAYLTDTVRDWLAMGKFNPRQRLAESLKVDPRKIAYGNHHHSHAAAAFFCSAFDEATVVTLDGVGEHETASVSLGRGTTLKKVTNVRFPNSIGLFYSAFTAYAGFEVNEGEYKLMGMAAFAEPHMLDEVRRLLHVRSDGTFALDQAPFTFRSLAELPFNARLVEVFGERRAPDSPFDPRSLDTDARRHAGIAASVQKVTEEVVLHVVDSAIRKTGVKDVCLAGGVALNCVANARLARELGCRLYVHPAAGDAGSALGAALSHYHVKLGLPRKNRGLKNVYLGLSVDDQAVDKAIAEAFLSPAKRYETQEELASDVAQRLAAGAVVGWMQGRAEWGPRALGNRSILANPTRLDMQGIVNEKIKFREPFRPFAPSVLKERASEFFDIQHVDPVAPEHFMLAVVRVREDAKSRIPAVTHVDGTARVQLVERETNPLYYELISRFGTLTGVPVLLNTSFNLRGEPIVNEPRDAIKTFLWSNMDYLVMGRTLLEAGKE
jgi:carbamoyltransferase